MPDPSKIQALTLLDIRDATQVYLDGGSVDAWERAMRSALARGHTAAFLVGTSERLGIDVGSALLSERRLSRAERDDIKQALKEQMKYLDGFISAVRDGDLSDAQIAARADMYSGATQATYNEAKWGDWDIPDDLLVGSGATPCMGYCDCAISVADNDDGTGALTRTLGGKEKHCDPCIDLASSSPHTVQRRKL